jgi:hypothetical protein
VLFGCTGAKPPLPPDPDFTCTFSHPSTSVNSLKKLPGPIQAALHERVGPMADRGEFFNNGDVVTRPAPFDRFIRGGEIGERWFVWHEHGGIAYWKQILLFGSDPSGTAHVIAEAHGASSESLCEATDRLLDGLTP